MDDTVTISIYIHLRKVEEVVEEEIKKELRCKLYEVFKDYEEYNPEFHFVVY